MNIIQYMTDIHITSSPTRLRRDRESAQRRKSILDAARRVFWKQGYAGTTMPSIAVSAQLAPGTLYLYFPSKDALYAELLAEGYELMQQRLADSLSGHSPPRRQAAALVDAFFSFAQDNPEYFDVMFFVLQKEGSNREARLAPEQVQRLKAAEDRCKAMAAQVLRHIGGSVSHRANESIEAIWSMLAGVIFYFRTDPRFQTIGAEAKRLLMTAVFGDK
jgi:AcrR family transcriptional regulator